MNAAVLRGRGRKVLTVLCALTLPVAASGCGDDRGLPPAGSSKSAAVGDVDYFDDDEYLGDKVTISAPVSEVLTTRVLILAGENYGDDSLLVLLPQAHVVTEGTSVTASGTVREFSYEEYRDEYDLEGPEPYDDFNDEQFLAADDLRVTASPSSSATTDPSP